MIRYNNLGSAVYAKEKLNGFEYPPGNRLVVNYVDDGEDRTRWGVVFHCSSFVLSLLPLFDLKLLRRAVCHVILVVCAVRLGRWPCSWWQRR